MKYFIKQDVASALAEATEIFLNTISLEGDRRDDFRVQLKLATEKKEVAGLLKLLLEVERAAGEFMDRYPEDKTIQTWICTEGLDETQKNHPRGRFLWDGQCTKGRYVRFAFNGKAAYCLYEIGEARDPQRSTLLNIPRDGGRYL